MSRVAEVTGTIVGGAIGAALVALSLLILASDCGPDGYGQRECLDAWGSALASLVTGK